MFYVYILKCNDGSYYTGLTDDVDRRVYEHNIGLHRNSYTYKRRPVYLAFFYEFETIEDAKDFEKQIKGWRREKKEALIAGRYDLLPDLAKGKKDNLN